MRGDKRDARRAVRAWWSAALVLAGTPAAAQAEEWRMVIARDDAVVIVDAATVQRIGQQIAFRTIIRWQKPDEDGAIGNVGTVTFDCAAKLVKSPGLRDIHPGGDTVVTKEQKVAFVPILPDSLGELMRERMCEDKWDAETTNGVPIEVPPEIAATAVFALLALGLDSDQSSALAASRYWDEESLVEQLDAYRVAPERRDAVRRVLADQTRPTPPPPAPPPPPIVPLASVVATGLVGRYIHTEHEMGAGLWLRADGTFRYGLTVGSLDETAAGRWTAAAGRVTLVSDPRPVPPTITPGPVTAGAPTVFAIRVVGPGGNDVPGVDFTIEFDAGEPLESYTPGNTWPLPPTEKRVPRFVTFEMPSYRLRSARLPIDGRAGHLANFVLTPNDFGVVDTSDWTVEADKDGLTVQRKDGVMHFDRSGD